MSLCPHRIVHPRLNGLLAARCSSLGGPYWRSRTLNIASGACNVSTGASPAAYAVREANGLATAADGASQLKSNHDSPKNLHPKTQQASTSTEQSGQTSTREFSKKNKTREPRTPASHRLHNHIVRATLGAEGLNLNLTDPVTQRLNNEIRNETHGRHLDYNTLKLATLIRASSIYCNSKGALDQWKLMYAEVYKAKHYQREVLDKAVIPGLGHEGRRLLREKIQVDCLGSFREEWQAMSHESKAWAWQRLAIWLMQNDPKLLLEFLSVTTEGNERPDFTMVVDCLLYVDNHYYANDEKWLDNWRDGARTYQSIIESCLHPQHWPIVSLPQKGVRLYIRRAGHEAVSLALETVKERSIAVRSETALCFMWRFTNFGDVDRALEALSIIPSIPKEQEPELQMNSQGVHRHCCKLLTLDTVEQGAGERNFKILPQLLEMGITPDRDMLNVVLHNAYKTDPQLGSDILKFMESHGYKLDSYSYLTLLGDAVARGDRARVDSFIREIGAKEDLRLNPWIASKIFHSYYAFTVKHMDADTDPSAVFYAMLDMYNHIHDITPLKELTVIPQRYIPRNEGAKIPPSPVALFLVLATYFRCQNRHSNVQRIYNRFRELVAQGHPSIAPMVETDHAHNEFLIAFRNSPRGLRSCVHVVEDMLGLPKSQETQNGQTILPARPTVRTWTLLLSAFTFNGQIGATEKIREMMDKHDVRYNDVTWNTIINGYVNSQNIPETAAAIKAMEQQGFPIDSYTMKSLRYLRDPERLWVAIEELDQKAIEVPEPNSESTVVSKREQRDQLVDSGLEKLGSKLNPKP